MQVKTSITGGNFEAKLSDRMTFSDQGAFRALLNDITRAGTKSCVIDLSGLASIDSAGLGMFVVARDQAKKNGWSLKVRCPPGQVRTLFELAKFDQLLVMDV